MDDNENALLWIGKPFDELNESEKNVFWKYETKRISPIWYVVFTHEESAIDDVVELREQAALKVFQRHFSELNRDEIVIADQYVQDKIIDCWKTIKLEYEGNMVDTPYKINLVGEIWSNISNSFLQPAIGKNGKGYERVVLVTPELGKKNCFVHVLLAQAFIPNNDPETCDQIDHVNCNKLCNWVRNLEWVSGPENMRRARENGLINNDGENCATSIYTKDQVTKACKLMVKYPLMPPFKVSQRTGISPAMVSMIRNGNAWRSVTCNYKFLHINFKIGENCNFAKYSKNQIQRVCEMLMDVHNTLDVISESTGVPQRTIWEVYTHREWKEVSSGYEFPERKRSVNPKREMVERLILEQGLDNQEITRLFMVEFNLDDHKAVQNYVSSVRCSLRDKGLIS